LPGQNAESLGLSGEETLDITGLAGGLQPGQHLQVHAAHPDGRTQDFEVILRIDTPIEVEYYRNGGILHTVLRRMLAEGA